MLTHRLRSTRPQAHRVTARLLTTRPVQIRRRFSQGPTGLQAHAAVTDSQPVDSLIIIPFVVVVVVVVLVSLVIVWRYNADHLQKVPTSQSGVLTACRDHAATVHDRRGRYRTQRAECASGPMAI